MVERLKIWIKCYSDGERAGHMGRAQLHINCKHCTLLFTHIVQCVPSTTPRSRDYLIEQYINSFDLALYQRNM